MQHRLTPVRRAILRLAAGLLVGLAAAPAAPAQAVPPLTWELVGTEASEVYGERIVGIAFREGPAPDGSLDTLYTVNGDGVSRFAPGADDWERICALSDCRAAYMEATKEGYLLIGSEAGPASDGARSIDGGRTWEDDVIDYGISALFQSALPALGGAVYAGNANSVSWSFDGGAPGSWTLGEPMGGQPAALAEAAPSASLPEGRLLGGPVRRRLADVPGGARAPLRRRGVRRRARLRARAPGRVPERRGRDVGGGAGRGAGGLRRGEPGLDRRAGRAGRRVERCDRRSGLRWSQRRHRRTAPGVGPVVASADGGQTWEVVADSARGWGGFGVNVFEVGRDGRLYAGTDWGVWRTASPLPVGSEPGAPERPEAALEVYPNPSDASVTVRLALDAGAYVRLAVHDLWGREVAVLHDGPLAAGEHELPLDVAGLPAGLYVVRATGDGSARRVG